MGPWKGIRFGTKDQLQLFDVTKDLREEKDVADKNAEIVKKIESIMSSARTESRHYESVEMPKPKKNKKKKK